MNDSHSFGPSRLQLQYSQSYRLFAAHFAQARLVRFRTSFVARLFSHYGLLADIEREKKTSIETSEIHFSTWMGKFHERLHVESRSSRKNFYLAQIMLLNLEFAERNKLNHFPSSLTATFVFINNFMTEVSRGDKKCQNHAMRVS